MLEWLINLRPDTASAILAAIAAIFSALAAWKGPIAAARLAEVMRRENDGAVERRKTKMFVFTTLMQDRITFYTPEAVRAFNLIDVVFSESRPVRDRWAEFFASLDPAKQMPEHEKQKRFRDLLSAMAQDLDLGDCLRLDDFERVYYPNALQEELNVQTLQRRAILKQLDGSSSPNANSTPSQIASQEFPPAPTRN
jgi:hypothetical protein